MNQQPGIVTLEAKKLIGMSIRTTPEDMMTVGLWRAFMPRRKEIPNTIDNVVYAVQVFDELPNYHMKEAIKFTKWAAVEVSDSLNKPEGMHSLDIPAGQYAIFIHEGRSEYFHQTMQYIFESWLPQSGYRLVNRPHLARMDERYLGPNNPNSMEEIYVPIE